MLAVACAAALVPLLATGASASSERPRARNGGPTGGATYVPRPEIKAIRCVQSCASRRRARGGSLLRITGRNLAAVTRVIFHGDRGRGDDAVAAVRPRSDRVIQLAVPLSARTGAVSAWIGERRGSRGRRLAILPPPEPEANPELTPVPGLGDPDAPGIETATSKARLFFGAERGVSFSFRVRHGRSVDVAVQLVSAAGGEVVRTWGLSGVPSGEVRSITWRGIEGGRVQPQGRYSFRVEAEGPNGARSSSAAAAGAGRDTFDFFGHMFPIRGRHSYGGAGSRFGSGRAGHSHQGQDVFARCGTRLVAARGGVVKFRQYHAAAGHYLVIDGERTGVDYAYMHLTSVSPFGPGDRVYTGQTIGTVGDSGNARACHLHFEMLGAPGWYRGGRPFDPLPHLRAWDRVS